MDRFYRTFDSPVKEDELSDSYDYTEIEMPAKNGGQLWADVIQTETLEAGMKGQVSIHDTFIDKSIKIDRECESFKVIPKKYISADKDRSLMSTVSYDENELFASDTANNENFGVRSTPGRIQGELGFTPYSRKHPEIIKMQNRKRRNANNDARTDGFLDRKHDQKYGHKYERFNPTDNVTKPKKKRKQQRNISLRNNFSYEDLYDATIPSNLTAIETGEWIAKTLGDIDTVPIENALAKIGLDEGTKLFNLTIQTEQSGGLQTNDGKRRRTPGGVFFEHLRTSDTISQEVKDEISKFGLAYFKTSKAATNR